MRSGNIVLQELKAAVAKERVAQIEVLHLLREVERDKHFLALGYPSLFEFATKELGYSAGAAFRRIQSMRLLKEIPSVEEKLASGQISLCVAAKTESFFQKNRPTPEAKQEILQSMYGASARECERKLAELVPERKTETVLEIPVTPELTAKLEKLKTHLPHKNLTDLLDKIAELALKELEKAVKPIQGNPHTRYIPAATKRTVWQRDLGQCTFRDPNTGRKCCSRQNLQFDHIFPYALGGKTVPQNLRLLCPAHNQFLAEFSGLRKPAG